MCRQPGAPAATWQGAKELAYHRNGWFIPEFIDVAVDNIVKEFLQKDILEKRTVLRKNKLEILLDDPRHLELEETSKLALSEHINAWLKSDGNSPYNYKVTDAVFRLAGTSSLGLKRYALLLKSINKEGEKYLLIDMKQSRPSSLTSWIAIPQPAWQNEADRIVSIQQRMQNRAPALLSTTMFNNDCYVIQEIQPTKDSINFKLLRKDYRHMYQVIDSMGMLTASAQLRSSGRQGADNVDALIEFAGEASWQEDIVRYAIAYAAKLKTYYLQFLVDYNKQLFAMQDDESAGKKKIA